MSIEACQRRGRIVRGINPGEKFKFKGKPLYIRRDDIASGGWKRPPKDFLADVVKARKGDQGAISRLNKHQLDWCFIRMIANDSWKRQDNLYVLKEPLRYAEAKALMTRMDEKDRAKLEGLTDEGGYAGNLSVEQLQLFAGQLNQFLPETSKSIGVLVTKSEDDTTVFQLCKGEYVARRRRYIGYRSS